MYQPPAIQLVIATDAHYVIMLAALLKSIEVNHISGEHIHVYIIEEKISVSQKKRIEESANPQMFSFTWLNRHKLLPPGIKLPVDRSSFPLIAYMRLFIADFLPAATEKALFIDTDMLMLKDISELWNTSLEGNIVAAAQDWRVKTFDNDWGGIKNYQALGFAPDTPYFNSGLLLIDIKKWREQQIAQKVIDAVNTHTQFAQYPDQYGLNVVLANRWLQLDGRWNYFAVYNSPEPYNIHFVSRKPFYKTYSSNPAYQQLFYDYLKQTPWRNTKPVGELQRYLKKLSNILQKFTG